MQKTYSKDNSVFLRRIVYGVGGVSLFLLWSSVCNFLPKEFVRYAIAVIWMFGAYGYFRSKNETLWIKLGDESFEYKDSVDKIHKTYHYKDIARINNSWTGVELRFGKGVAERSIEILTSPFKNSRELKKELRQRWQQATIDKA